MARRNDHTRDQLIALTLDAVKSFLESKSHHELSLRKVATMIGYVPSTLVNVFGNYNLLLLRVVANTLDELSMLAQQSVATATDNRDALKKLAYLYHDFACDNPHRWQLIFAHSMNGEQLPEWQANRIDGMTGMLEHLLVNIGENKSCDEVVEASRVLWAGVHGITMLSVDDKFFSRQPMDGKALIDNLLDSYLSSW
ncbi:TetR/AcrR family transcriptional regulator [Vibrio maerlii]|uniref:TetR/AcrR family transcriptional regulator n=1 Tax=Vibrio maerlii TaxID=2231648 RepID=UPI000E3D29D4|nr:TetR-like C-terminal domain-containing protein [Vibrio maerlii]